MKLVIDTSILVGSLIKRGYLLFTILRISRHFELLSPDFLIEELYSKAKKISNLSKLSKTEVEFAISVLTSFVKIVPKSEYQDRIDEAKELAKQFDYKDYPFIALALKLNVPIWTNDKPMIVHGLKSGKYLALDTQAVEDLVKGKSLEEIKEGLKRRYL